MNSSIFNFEVPAGILSAPTKTKAWFLFLGIGALACTCFTSAILNRWIPEGDRAQHRAAPPDTRVLLLGNSQFLGVSIAAREQAFFNAALPGSDYVMQEAVFNAQLKFAPGINTLLLGFDNVPFWVRGIEDRKGDYSDILDCGVPWHEIPEIAFGKRLEAGVTFTPLLRPILSGKKPELLPVFANCLKAAVVSDKTAENRLVPFDPMRVIPPYKVAPGDGAKKMGMYLRTERRKGMLGNLAAFLRIIEVCKEKGIRIVLLRSPTCAEFRAARSQAWSGQLDSIKKQAQDAYGMGEIPVWDDDRNDIFPVRYFDDPNHLNSDGATRYSDIIKDRLGTLLDSSR